MSSILTIPLGGTLGNITGANSDGVLLGQMTATACSAGFLKTHAQALLCIVDKGGTYTDETTTMANATADDVEVFTGTPAVDDAIYYGNAAYKFGRVDVNLTSAGVGTWTVELQYFNGSSWAACTTVVDGTTAYTSSTGFKSITFDIPSDWVATMVDNVYGYWVRHVITVYSALTTLPQVGQGYSVVPSASATWTTDTTDVNDAGTADVALLPAYPTVGDGFYFGHLTEKFCRIQAVYSTARTGTATLTWKYWNGSSFTALTTVEDDTAGWSTTAGTEFVHFVPPSDWAICTAADGPNETAGYFVVCEMTAITSVTAQPVGSRFYVYPLITGATGLALPDACTFTKCTSNALTKSATNADSVFLLINARSGATATFTWTKDVASVAATVSLSAIAGDHLLVTQITEDGTTEFANGALHLQY
jgi:hypothetical protein